MDWLMETGKFPFKRRLRTRAGKCNGVGETDVDVIIFLMDDISKRTCRDKMIPLDSTEKDNPNPALSHLKISYKDKLIQSSFSEKILDPRTLMDIEPSAHQRVDHFPTQSCISTASSDSAADNIPPHMVKEETESSMENGSRSPR